MDINQVVIQPLMSEKSTGMRDVNKYVFQVHSRATKTQIKDSLEKLFNVHVRDVRIMNIKPKARRIRFQFQTHLPGYKKAIVTLAEGDTIDFFGDL